jgi:hypothetical protein
MEDNIRLDLKEIKLECVNWTDLALQRGRGGLLWKESLLGKLILIINSVKYKFITHISAFLGAS